MLRAFGEWICSRFACWAVGDPLTSCAALRAAYFVRGSSALQAAFRASHTSTKKTASRKGPRPLRLAATPATALLPARRPATPRLRAGADLLCDGVERLAGVGAQGRDGDQADHDDQ